MKHNQLIENTNNLSQTLRNIFTEYGLEKTLLMTGLNVFQLFDRMGKVSIDPDKSYDILFHIFTNDQFKDALLKKIGYFTLHWDSSEGIMRWIYRKGDETMESMCTPYWDGYKGTPVFTEYYTYNKNGDTTWKEKEDYIQAPLQFDSLEELIDWFNSDYILKVHKRLMSHLKSYREEYN
jgi:hypothetical protein